ncbi:MAG: VanZ family protein, partial [Lachnospiraceae bacterium]|nr:VanZ family protein [Lachnospiraceae bacterium]
SAAADEIHQLFVPDRWGSFADVLLDTCGGAFGVLICVFAERIYHKIRRRG